MSADYDSRVAVVTGGSSGSGKAAATLFVKRGCQVMICARDDSRLRETQAELAGFGSVAWCAGDMANRRDAERLIERTVVQFGRVDVLAICHGYFAPFVHFLDLTDDDWDVQLRVHLHGAIYVSRAAAIQMRAQGEGGAIVTVSSINAWQAEPHFVPHSVAKAGVVALTRGMACDLAPYGIRVNGVAPAWVDSPMSTADLAGIRGEPIDCNFLQRPAKPEEIAEVIYFLSTPAASALAGETIMVDCGQKSLLTGLRTVRDSDRIDRMRTWKTQKPGERGASLNAPHHDELLSRLTT